MQLAATPKTLTGLCVQAYEHPQDAATLNLLKKTPALDAAVRKVNEWGLDRRLRVQLTGSYLRATPDRFPELHELLHIACRTLDCSRVPDLYVASMIGINSTTVGVERPLVVLYSATVEYLTPEELLYVIGTMIGRIKSDHLLYIQIAETIGGMAEALGVATTLIDHATFGFTDLVRDVLHSSFEYALLRWKRMSAFTIDRAGLLACQNVDAALRAMMKLAGLPPKYFGEINTADFVAQAREFEAMNTDSLSVLARWVATLDATHPWMVERAKELDQWVQSGGYEDVLRAPQRIQHKLPVGIAAYCNQCGWPLKGTEAFCPGCKHPQEWTRGKNP